MYFLEFEVNHKCTFSTIKHTSFSQGHSGCFSTKSLWCNFSFECIDFMFVLTFCTNDNVIAPLWHFIFQWYLQKLQMTFVKCPIWIWCINKFAFRSISEKCFLHGFPQKCQNWWMLKQIRSGVIKEREKAALRVCISQKNIDGLKAE